ncbi:hypothetical protein J6590_034345 [Homalodisca vitripennis]|nr:hypothetical protein J6590_034345 [Homalodisca vitripennis]
MSYNKSYRYHQFQVKPDYLLQCDFIIINFLVASRRGLSQRGQRKKVCSAMHSCEPVLPIRIASTARAFPTTRNTPSSAVRVGKGPAWRPQVGVFFGGHGLRKDYGGHPPGKETRSGPQSGPDPLTERLDKERAPQA